MRSSQIALYMFRSEQDRFVETACRDFDLHSVFIKRGESILDNNKFIGKRTVRYIVPKDLVGSVRGVGEEGIAIDTSLSPVIEIQRSTIERRNGNTYLRRGRLYASFTYYQNGAVHEKDNKIYTLYKSLRKKLILSSVKYEISGSVVYASKLSDEFIRKRKIVPL